MKNPMPWLMPIGFMLAAILACQAPGVAPRVDVDEQGSATMAALATISAGTLEPALGQTLAPTEEEAPQETPTETPPTPSPTPTVEHVTFPSDSPTGVLRYITDRSTKALASERRAIADNFNINLLERPFTSEVMDYLGYVDLTRVELLVNPPWVYMTHFLEGSPPEGAPVWYGVEFDLDIDGRGDVLVMGLVPEGTEWTVAGVVALKDGNNDVGGAMPVFDEAPQPAWDGYDDLVFDQGQGADPDTAWIRRHPGHEDRVQVALKFELINSDGEFMFWGWSDEGVKDPELFDYNDGFTPEDAGSPASNSSDYPVKGLWGVDNTCRFTYGFEPDGSEPGVCPVPATPTPELGAIRGLAFNDWDGDGTKESGEPGRQNVDITLGEGSCPSSGLRSGTTGANGRVSFGNLPSGTYCISSESPMPSVDRTTPGSYTIDLDPGETIEVEFGYQPPQI
jgi:hypothetical protein